MSPPDIPPTVPDAPDPADPPGITPAATEALGSLARLAGDERAWLVGGALRDEALGRSSRDLDVAVNGDARGLARALAREQRANVFALSDAFGAWRVSARDRTWQIDLTPLLGVTLEEDLARRDLTVNALARPAAGGDRIDRFGGLEDLAARRLRMVGPDAFAADPLRIARTARLAASLGFTVDQATAAAARSASPGLSAVSAERIFAELKAIVAGPAPRAGLEHLEALGASAVVLPELLALHGVQQSRYHHRDVHDHTLETLDRAIELTSDPGTLATPQDATAIREILAEPLADELTRGEALRWGALLHDVAKPLTRAVDHEGRVGFPGHDVRSAEITHRILERLRASERLTTHVAALARHHLRLGFLVWRDPLPRREVYTYLRTCEPVEVDVTLLSAADRLATLGPGTEVAVARHVAFAKQMLPQALTWRQAPPRPPIRGDRLAAELGLAPGPELGRALAELTEAAWAGEVTGEAAAVEYARAWLGRVGSEPA